MALIAPGTTVMQFQGLAPCNERAQVSNFGVTRDGADAFIAKRSEQARQCVALTLRVCIDKDDETVTHGGETALQGPRFATILLLQYANARIDVCDVLNLRGGFIARTIIDNDDFDLAFVVAGQKRT